MINNVWLTVNRGCNLRCKWCYAKGTEYIESDNMPVDLAKRLVDFSKEIGSKSITLIGGEPSIYPDILELINYINHKGLRSVLVTNGYKLSEMSFLNELKSQGLDMIGFSIKAANRQQQIDLTRRDCFDKIIKSMKNLQETSDIKFAYSTVISKDTVDNLDEFAKMVVENSPGKGLNFSFCNPSFGDQINDECVMSREEIVDKVVNIFPKVSKILNNKAILQQSIPECFWPEDFLKDLREKNQISFGCHVMRRNGLIFDTEGKVLVCNNLPDFPIGVYGKDFDDKLDFDEYWNSKQITLIYDKFYEYPEIRCQSCEKYLKCAGGCGVKWFAYKGLPMREECFYAKV